MTTIREATLERIKDLEETYGPDNKFVKALKAQIAEEDLQKKENDPSPVLDQYHGGFFRSTKSDPPKLE